MIDAYYLFPFEMVEKGSRIVLYCAGKVGTCYKKQLEMTNYCDVVLWVDQNYKNVMSKFGEICSPEQILNCEYDYIVVALSSEWMTDEIQRTLKFLEIDWKKVIIPGKRTVLTEETPFSLEEMMSDGDAGIDMVISDFLETWCRDFDHLFPIFFGLRYSKEKESYVQLLKKYIASNVTMDKKWTAIHILYRSGYFDAELMASCMELALQEEDVLKKYWMSIFIGTAEFLAPQSVYPQYYEVRKKLMRELSAKLFDACCLPEESVKRTRGRIVILAPYMHSYMDSLMQLIAPYANELTLQGKQVKIVLTESHIYTYGEFYFQPLGIVGKNSKAFSYHFREFLDPQVEVIFNMGSSTIDRVRSCIQTLKNLAPQMILDFTAKHSYLTYGLHQWFPIICVSTGGYCPTGTFDRYICRNKQHCIEENLTCHAVEEEKMVELPYGTQFIPPQTIYKRDDFAFSASDFILITVGNRLTTELTEDFVRQVCSLLKKHPAIKWLIVGLGEDYLKKNPLPLEPRDQVILWGYESNLAGLYAICNVYIDPIRMGGAGSIVTAINMGLPVATIKRTCDALLWIGEENAITGTYSDLTAYVEELYSHPAAYKQARETMLARAKEGTMSKRVKCLIDLIEDMTQ